MVNSNLIPMINSCYTGLTKSEKKVADIVLKNPQNIIYSSVTDLAEEANVGEATVLRFCRKMGFKGYQGFKMTLAQSIRDESDNTSEVNEEIKKSDSLQDVCKKVLNTNINALNETFSLIDFPALDRVVSLMVDAKRIMFVGSGTSAISAFEARTKFMRIFPYVEFNFDAHLQSMAASLMNEKELCIAFSYSGSTTDTIDVLKTAKEAGAHTVCITRFAKSPITEYADEVLILGTNEGPLQGGAFSTKMAQLYILDILYTEYFRRTTKVSMSNRNKTAAAVSDKLY